MTRLFAASVVSSVLLLVNGIPKPAEDISVNGLSFVPSSTASGDVSVNGPVSFVSDIPNAATTTAPMTAPSVATILQTFTVSGKLVVKSETITVYPTGYDTYPSGWSVVPTFTSSADASSGSSSKSHSAAIAGGVIGALAAVVAVILALLYFIFRKKKSPGVKQWRHNPKWRLGWQKLDAKNPQGDAAPGRVHYDLPYDGSSAPRSPATPFADTTTPIAPLFIREKHRPAAADPFSDPHTSPKGGSARGHQRNTSSFGGAFASTGHYRDESIEMNTPNAKN